ncbi:MAG TPA: MFS transporter [Candidatus Thermoplasmatota archaeon]|nr:MFS transporter [Candidatus Thermoplasmatota archaeon]
MAAPERRILGAMSLVLLLRVFGFSLVLVGFASYGATLTDSLFLVGLAFSLYGLAMALFLIPIGRLSDRYGRRRVMMAGLVVTFVGSLACAAAPTIELLLAARFLQGAGAVNGVALAWVGDATAPERRTRSMAVLGVTAGGSVVLGFALGALLVDRIGVPGLFLGQAGMALLAILVVASTPEERGPVGRTPTLREVLATPAATQLATAGFALNLLMTGATFAIPLLALGFLGQAEALPGWLGPGGSGHNAMIPMLLFGGAILLVTARLGDKGHARPVALGGFLLLAAAPAGLLLSSVYWAFLVAGILFFAAHSTLSALLPSLATRLGGGEGRGALLSAYSVSQYVGTSLAGPLAGALLPHPGWLALVFGAIGVAGLFAALPLARQGQAVKRA